MRFALRKKHLLDLPYFIRYIFRYWQNKYLLPVDFYNDEGLKEAIQSGKSLVRIGDGEIGLIHYNPIHYQKWSRDIQKEFKQMLTNYQDDDAYIIGLPLFTGWTNDELRNGPKAKMLDCWISLKLTYEMLANKNAKYFDQHIFYKDNKLEEIILPFLKTKQCILVANKSNIQKMKQSSIAESIHFCVEAPSANAFESRDQIEREIVSVIEKSGKGKEDCVVLMQCGLAKTIIPHMSRSGYQLLDIGKGLEAYTDGVSIEYLI